MALPVNGSTHLISAYYTFIDPERTKGWVGLVGWPIADGSPTLVVTHQLQVERRTGKVRQSETDVLPLCHATNSGGATNNRVGRSVCTPPGLPARPPLHPTQSRHRRTHLTIYCQRLSGRLSSHRRTWHDKTVAPVSSLAWRCELSVSLCAVVQWTCLLMNQDHLHRLFTRPFRLNNSFLFYWFWLLFCLGAMRKIKLTSSWPEAGRVTAGLMESIGSRRSVSTCVHDLRHLRAGSS